MQLRNFLTLLKKYAKDVDINEYKGQIPPASFQTFLKNYTDMAGIVVTDHNNSSYTNKFYNSMYDNAENLNYKYLNSTDVPKDSIQQHIADVSMILARSLYEEITKQEAPIPDNLNVTVSIIIRA